ncbi:cyclophilin-like fold protein [Hydrogenophaga sp.]|uniref:cyclophilin-like fold protein n=1 Tax=Hydrogenophaga sp. TaxID=1904254 RepID=UPI0027183192|nr:cyclophilin-like fold protein [Hydrogenophaga sp.]MDO9436534.1 cyclophilin-like fold protein [Hydrogenophaga sp.]
MTLTGNRFTRTIRPCSSWRLRLAGLCLSLLVTGSSHAEPRLWMTVGESRLAVSLADTDAARAFTSRLPMTLDMTDLNNNEKKFDLPQALPANPSRPETICNGDLMLYGANTVVLFYRTFDSPYSYTRLGRVDDPNALAQVLGQRDVRVQFSRD